MFLSQLLNGVFQVIIFSIVPFVWWFITAREKEKFFKWLGLKKTDYKNI